jgi:hypothetical protein
VQTTFQSIADLVPKLLGDLDTTLWTDAQTKPFINSALREFHQLLRDAGVRQLVYRTTYASLPASTTAITTTTPTSNTLPADLIVPIAMWEADTGTTGIQDFVKMRGPARLPNLVQDTTLGFWDWRGGAIALVGATQARRVMLDYYGSYANLNLLSDTVQTPDATEPIAYLAASKIADAQGNERFADRLKREGLAAADRIANVDIKASQAVAFRRQPRLGYIRYPTFR